MKKISACGFGRISRGVLIIDYMDEEKESAVEGISGWCQLICEVCWIECGQTICINHITHSIFHLLFKQHDV